MIEIEAEEEAERHRGRDAVPPDEVRHSYPLGRAGARQRSLYTNILRIKKYEQREGRHAAPCQLDYVCVVRVESCDERPGRKEPARGGRSGGEGRSDAKTRRALGARRVAGADLRADGD